MVFRGLGSVLAVGSLLSQSPGANVNEPDDDGFGLD